MGDHRAECRIQFEFHGVKRQLDLDWVNWDELEGEGIDSRVREFFSNAVDEAMTAYYTKVAEWEEERDKEHTEQREREELVRLKAKYERGAT